MRHSARPRRAAATSPSGPNGNRFIKVSRKKNAQSAFPVRLTGSFEPRRRGPMHFLIPPRILAAVPSVVVPRVCRDSPAQSFLDLRVRIVHILGSRFQQTAQMGIRKWQMLFVCRSGGRYIVCLNGHGAFFVDSCVLCVLFSSISMLAAVLLPPTPHTPPPLSSRQWWGFFFRWFLLITNSKRK